MADGLVVAPLPAEVGSLAAQVMADPIVGRTFGIFPTSLGLVEFDRLVVYQKHINLAYARRIQSEIGSTPSPETVFRLCLPFEHPNPPFRARQIAQNADVFVSLSDDFRFQEPTLLRGEPIADYAPRGPIAGVIGLVVGYGANYLNTIEVDNRLVLNNGSHRAFALRDLGVTHAPCLILHVSRREELPLVGAGDLAENVDLYLTAPRPPLLKDYFDPRLRTIVPVPRKERQIRVTFGIEQVDVPA